MSIDLACIFIQHCPTGKGNAFTGSECYRVGMFGHPSWPGRRTISVIQKRHFELP